MILGVGTDILLIDRLRRNPEDLAENSPFLRKTYTPAEQQAAQARPDPILFFSTRFAGKEAVFKALGSDDSQIRLDQIEILNRADGQPQVTLYGRMKELAEAKGVNSIHISLSYDTDYAIAFVVASSEEQVTRNKERGTSFELQVFK
ncbi:MAG TPA: holo-[acyl-carrier-protein] synthase [Clostridiales bacterium]|nr:holo-[acyl-carrier-protein] synthase [Clostridiales bacterium]